MKPIKKAFNALGFSSNYFKCLALKTKFKKRVNKLKAFNFLEVLILASNEKFISYGKLSALFSTRLNIIISKQALHKAMAKKEFKDFVEQIFYDLLHKKLNIKDAIRNMAFNRILVQDSTIIKVPNRLYDIYSGVRNAYAKVANARLQFVLDLVNHSCINFSINTYSKQDVNSNEYFEIEANDLILKDRGYFSFAEVTRIIRANAWFIFRFRNNLNLYDVKSGKPINIAKKLGNKTLPINFSARIQSKDGPIVSIFTMRMSEDVLRQRIKQAKKNSHNRKISKEVKLLLKWSIYISNLANNEIDYDIICRLYKLRWRIEIIFKALKSNLNLGSYHNVSAYQLEFLIILRFINLLLILKFIFNPMNNICPGKISIIKLTNFLISETILFMDIITSSKNGKLADEYRKLLVYHCSYDKRSRENYFGLYENLFPLS